ncbi:DUF3348 family protein [Alloalcanivorax mobilis]|uniref:DUF3348 family protein n=1 Tax=Alloalcanivorax mobilis TaxID=2019569 RepID=UPI0013000C14|nr:DUF3348 family protein [Alloalcanivorax mobilis]
MHRKQTSAPTAAYSARLVRLLATLEGRKAAPPAGSFAERLGRLFDLPDTIALDHARQHYPAGPFAPQPDLARRLREDADQLRDSQVARIAEAFSDGGSAALRLPPPETNAAGPSFKPYQRFYLGHQRQQIASIQPLRLRLRQVLAGLGPEQAQLAALDAVFDNALAGYGRRGFDALPAVLERRFRALWREHRERQPDALQQDPAAWLAPGAWLHRFCQEMRLMLLAELETRLQPVQGLLDALNQEDHDPR